MLDSWLESNQAVSINYRFELVEVCYGQLLIKGGHLIDPHSHELQRSRQHQKQFGSRTLSKPEMHFNPIPRFPWVATLFSGPKYIDRWNTVDPSHSASWSTSQGNNQRVNMRALKIYRIVLATSNETPVSCKGSISQPIELKFNMLLFRYAETRDFLFTFYIF